MREQGIVSASLREEERQFETALRRVRLADFRMDILIGTGPGARTGTMDIKHFTAIGATTRQGMISAPLRGRFGLVLRLNPYDAEELGRIVHRSARLLEIEIDEPGAAEI